MSNYDNDLINDLRACAAELKAAAEADVDLQKMASVDAPAASTSRSDYLTGVIEGLGIR